MASLPHSRYQPLIIPRILKNDTFHNKNGIVSLNAMFKENKAPAYIHIYVCVYGQGKKIKMN